MYVLVCTSCMCSIVLRSCLCVRFIFFFNDTATTEIYTLSLHDALPISRLHRRACVFRLELAHLPLPRQHPERVEHARTRDRKSTRLNSSHANISYAVFCLKKKKHTIQLQATVR